MGWGTRYLLQGPKQERLVISEDPEIALAKLLRPTTKKAR